MGIGNIVFIILLIGASFLFAKNIRRLVRNINLGKDQKIDDRKGERWSLMARVALGQSKMVVRPIPGILHVLVYAGFVIINIEVLEIVIDGVLGTHRVFSFLGGFYDVLIGSFEVLALLVLVACVIFLIRREVLRIKRFWNKEMGGWPRTDATLILVMEILLMGAFLKMNATDQILAERGVGHYIVAGSYPISSMLRPFFEGMSDGTLVLLERSYWWFHIVGILAFLNYLPYSKHLHILLAFPNVWYSKLQPKTEIANMPRVTGEVRSMMDPSIPPPEPAAQNMVAGAEVPDRFGAKDIFDLSWKSLMDAYSCTECGRCTSECPANLTGKLLSPRKIMMDTRDRVAEVGRVIDAKGKWEDDGNSLHSRITDEELWACTTCNACTEACPVNIDPVNIIVEMRRYLVMEESKTRPALTSMFNNVENNGAPWAFGPDKRMEWTEG
ncbi:MAG TPA: (Fe-S)-binding protein [Flavobacteriales bacterium]|jgi:heterodisulfide reductase subunit C|nr:(Fe-S)-binding protein [Flavobacteriales bacterium]MBK8531979.1 (Fe-S)-binding protein [Flavobacteriales bacterium]MBK8707833.1 (Fe-S)-binding protein [Flavobacteriales bacterium]MBP8877924.1 (Fe-S)-binding protein [Flavobacteriales bacterium]MBP9178274.1 (Fe-S)-binding protein [Flavobacteriales bacterium]